MGVTLAKPRVALSAPIFFAVYVVIAREALRPKQSASYKRRSFTHSKKGFPLLSLTQIQTAGSVFTFTLKTKISWASKNLLFPPYHRAPNLVDIGRLTNNKSPN
jgi:hypothetical protein